MKESDLYLPLKQFLESQGYEVKGEVEDCDVLAVRGDEDPVIVELKLSLNLAVVLQAVERLSLTSTVYIGVPEKNKTLQQQQKRIKKMLRMLGLGLVTINPARKVAPVAVLLDPGEYRPRKSKPRTQRLLGEFAQRVGDPNAGGSDRRKGVMTAYRQQALAIAGYLDAHGPAKASDLARDLGIPASRGILYRNVYGWFERGEKPGIYALSPLGKQDMTLWLKPGNV